MKSFIKQNSIQNLNGIIKIQFSTSPCLDKYFNQKEFIYECKQSENIPISILTIPFICNVLPIIWLTDSTLIIKELDKTFYYSINEFKEGYIKMYPQLQFKGEVCVDKLVINEYSTNKNLVLFSGGIDAICTTLRHQEENLLLLTLWGSADYPTDDIKGWELHWNDITYNTQQLKLQCDYIKTNFCDFIPLWGKELRKLVKAAHAEWWHDFQHGIGILGHTAPYAYIHNIKTVYIASSFDESRKPYTCASDPTIDNYVKFGSTQVFHDGYEWNRQEKIKYIATKIKEQCLNLNFHVCLQQYLTTNCCRCEKCYRTIIGLLAEGLSPQQYGFNFDLKDIPQLCNDLHYRIMISKNKKNVYKTIQNRILENQSNIPAIEDLQPFIKLNFDTINCNLPKFPQKARVAIKNIFNKLIFLK